MRRELGLMIAISALCACGGQTFTAQGDAGSDGSSSSSGGNSSSGGSSGGSSSSSGGSSSSSGGSSSSSGGSSSSSGSSSGGSSSGADGGGRVPVNHRTDDSQCSQPAPAGTCSFGGSGGMCSSDAQCADAGANGRCIEYNGGVAFCGCTHDACMHDTDCTGETCACHGSPYAGGAGNTCVPGNCRVDSDCGPGGYCSPTYSTSGCGSLGGYYCHTPGDQCIDDSDCTGGLQVCAYSTTASRWECQQQVLCQ